MIKAVKFPITEDVATRRSHYRSVIEEFPDKIPLSYFVKEEDSDFLKIGMVSDKWNIEQRVSALQTSTPHRLFLIGITDVKESDLHRRFSHLRVRGEWFKYTAEIKTFLKEEFSPLPWLRLMKCPSCKQTSTFRHEQVCIMKFGESFPISITRRGDIFIDFDKKKRLDFPSDRNEFDTTKCRCDQCGEIVNISDIKLVDE